MDWDVSSFGNEQAQNWLTSLSDEDSTDVVELTLAKVYKSDIFIDGQDAERGIAAAELVAASHKRPTDLLPMEAAFWIKTESYLASRTTVKLAKKVVDKVFKNSELRDLWDGTDAAIEWQRAVKDLMQRLDSIEFEESEKKEEKEELPKVKKKKALTSNVEPLFNAAVKHVSSGNHRGAVGKFNQALELDPEYLLGYIGRGTSYLAMGKYTEAVSDFNEAIDRDPEIADAYYLRAQAYFQQSNYGRAIADLTILLNLTPEKLDAYVMRGIANFALGRDERAKKDFTAAINKDSRKANAYLHRAKVYEREGQFELAGADRKVYEELLAE